MLTSVDEFSLLQGEGLMKFCEQRRWVFTARR